VVTVSARAASGGEPGASQRREVEFSVHNTGSFIDENMRKKIFEPFFTSKRTGMGLGLSIVQEITQSHGGRLWVESDREKGTRFAFRIPSLD